MPDKEKKKNSWEKDLWLAIREQDVLLLRKQLGQNQNLNNGNYREKALNALTGIQC